MYEPLVNYAIVFKNYKNKVVLCDSKGLETTIDRKPFYTSKENALKGIKKIKRVAMVNLKHQRFWYNKNLEENNTSAYALIQEREYLNTLKIIEEDSLSIVEVKISIEM